MNLPFSMLIVSMMFNADLQMVNITLRVLSKPDTQSLPTIFKVSAAMQYKALKRFLGGGSV